PPSNLFPYTTLFRFYYSKTKSARPSLRIGMPRRATITLHGARSFGVVSPQAPVTRSAYLLSESYLIGSADVNTGSWTCLSARIGDRKRTRLNSSHGSS